MNERIAGAVYVFARYWDGGTLAGNGYLEVFASDPDDAITQARAYPWPAGSELGAARELDAFKVAEWVSL